MFGIVRAPEIDRPGLSWFNVEKPLSLSSLAGRLVILDFWTFCCINCHHILPTLKRLEETYAGELVVVGVHSPKFPHEQDPDAVARAIARHDIVHPVVHDPALVLWEEYCVRAWPTLVLISPDGMVIGQLSGEPHPDLLSQGLGDMIRQFFARGELAPRALALKPIRDAGGALRFPGKIKACPSVDGGPLWALADTGHHQIVVLEDDGSELVRYGSGRAGWHDGGVEACFDQPQGLACDAESIYVADTGNHLLRRIDRASGLTETIAGLGVRGGILRHPEPALAAALASPWDVEIKGSLLYFANAGSHQIGVLDLATGMVRAAAGTGAENLADGPAADALLAQPSGLALAPGGEALYFADSETSAIRRLDLAGGRVETLAGKGLFTFGHVDGSLGEALLQHPLGVSAVDGRVYVADSFNGAVRAIDLGGGAIRDVDGLACLDQVCAPPSEPAGIAADGPDRLLVSDTNNHRILELDLARRTTRTWYA